MPEAATPHLGAARGGRAPGWCGPLVALSVSSSGSVSLPVKYGFLQYFSGFFPKLGFLHKNKTPW